MAKPLDQIGRRQRVAQGQGVLVVIDGGGKVTLQQGRQPAALVGHHAMHFVLVLRCIQKHVVGHRVGRTQFAAHHVHQRAAEVGGKSQG